MATVNTSGFIVYYVFIVFFFLGTPMVKATGGACTRDMFADDENAYLACQAEYALQRNWYPSPIAGLFSYQEWNGFDGFWQNGAGLEPMMNFMVYGNNTRYQNVVQSSWRQLYSLLEAYAPQPSYDDMGWYGLAYARAYEVFGWQEFLVAATSIYDWCWQNGWDKTGACGGGFWFDQTLGSKQTITNVQMLQLAAKLYRLTNKTDVALLQKINQTWNFIAKNNIINATTFQVADGVTGDCKSNGVYGPTYNSGVLIGGLVELYKMDSQSKHLELGYAIANSTIKMQSINGVLTEYCDVQGCSDDAKMFKGIFVRNLRYLMDVSTKERFQLYSSWLNYNIQSVMKNSMCNATRPNTTCKIDFRDGRPFYNRTGPVFGVNWHGPYNYSAPMQQTSVLELLVAGISPGTKCRGDGCQFQPTTPPPHPLTCRDNPCPSNEQCCTYQSIYYTCCNPDQKCVNGYCD